MLAAVRIVAAAPQLRLSAPAARRTVRDTVLELLRLPSAVEWRALARPQELFQFQLRFVDWHGVGLRAADAPRLKTKRERAICAADQ